jgi:hypothetical protein
MACLVIDDAGRAGGSKIVEACAAAAVRSVKRGEPFVFRLPDAAGINLVHGDWVIAAMLDLARMPSGPGRTYHLTAPKSILFRDLGGILTHLVPNLALQFEPEFQRSDLPDASRLFDKAAAEWLPCFAANLPFDRTHAARDLSPALRRPVLKLKPFVESCLRAERDRVAERPDTRGVGVAGHVVA